MLIRGNALELPLADDSIDLVVTSPAYPEQRYYGDSELELGHEGTLDGFVRNLVDVFAGVRPALRPGASVWLNLGDKSNGSGGAGGDWSRGGDGVRAHRGLGAKTFRDPAYLDQTFLDAPGAVLRGLLLDGWRLRGEVIWQRGTLGRPKLERIAYSHARRPKVSHEKLYLLAPGPGPIRFYPSMLEEEGTVWTFPPGGSGPAHLAPFPDELARRCILASSLPGDVVLDFFDGSGTTRRVAGELGRHGVGVDLYAGLERINGQARTLDLEKSSNLVTKAGTVDLEDLSRVGLKPATLYYVSRQITAGRTLDDLTLEQKLTPEQVAYVTELINPQPEDEAS